MVWANSSMRRTSPRSSSWHRIAGEIVAWAIRRREVVGGVLVWGRTVGAEGVDVGMIEMMGICKQHGCSMVTFAWKTCMDILDYCDL
jgi:hypothetical protein